MEVGLACVTIPDHTSGNSSYSSHPFVCALVLLDKISVSLPSSKDVSIFSKSADIVVMNNIILFGHVVTLVREVGF